MQQQLKKTDDKLKEILKTETSYNTNIHHYTSPEGLKSILTNKTIWFSDIRFLNDSSENNYIYSLFPKYPDTYTECLLDKKYFEMIESISEQYLCKDYCCINKERLWAENIFVASFSKDKDALMLWNYYTKTLDNIGYNITFYNQPFKFEHPCYKYICGLVIYNSKKQRELLKDIIIKYNEIYIKYKNEIEKNEKLKSDFIFSFINIIELYNIFFKHPKFENEQEYRFALYNISCCPSFIPKYRIHKGAYIPYFEIPFDKEMIPQIGVGPSGNSDLMTKGVKLFVDSIGLSWVHVWPSRIPLRH